MSGERSGVVTAGRWSRALMAPLLALALSACAGRSSEPEVVTPPGPISVSVINSTTGEVTVGASWAGADPISRHTVAGNAETAFEMPYDERLLRFIVEVGSATVRTNAISARPADRLRITVTPPARVVVDRLSGG